MIKTLYNPIVAENAKKEGKLETLTKLLIKKFGNLPQDYSKRLKGVSAEGLDEILINIFDLEKIDDLKKFL